MQATGERTRERQYRETFSLHTHEYCSRWRRIEGGTKLGGGRSSHSRTHTRSEQCAAWAGRNGGEYRAAGKQKMSLSIIQRAPAVFPFFLTRKKEKTKHKIGRTPPTPPPCKHLLLTFSCLMWKALFFIFPCYIGRETEYYIS